LPHYFASVFNAPDLLEFTGCGNDAAKLMSENDDNDDGHRGIPRDAEGNPIFLILPPGMQAQYDRRMEKCEKGWLATHHPGFISEAEAWRFLHRQPGTLWLSEAIMGLTVKRLTKTYVTRAYNDAVRLMRCEAVQTAKREEGLSWGQAYKRAAELLKGTHAAGKPSTMKKAYVDVMADLKAGRGSIYLTPLKPRRTLSDALKATKKEAKAG
jgi:hypothetical protein